MSWFFRVQRQCEACETEKTEVSRKLYEMKVTLKQTQETGAGYEEKLLETERVRDDQEKQVDILVQHLFV